MKKVKSGSPKDANPVKVPKSHSERNMKTSSSSQSSSSDRIIADKVQVSVLKSGSDASSSANQNTQMLQRRMTIRDKSTQSFLDVILERNNEHDISSRGSQTDRSLVGLKPDNSSKRITESDNDSKDVKSKSSNFTLGADKLLGATHDRR